MPPIHISLSPNAEPDDLRLAFELLRSPGAWYQPGSVSRLEQQLSTLFHGRSATATSSGRQALRQALEAHHIGTGDEVIIQAFTCVSVPAAISWTGATPVFADIDAATYNLDPDSVAANITSRTKAIVVQHTFGIPGPLTELKKLARQHGVTLIEDCAHALGGTYQGQLLGTHGDTAIVSFGRDKVISSVFGGAVITQHAEVAERLQATQAARSAAPRWWIAQQLVHPLIMAGIKPTYFAGGRFLLPVLQKARVLSKAVTYAERSGGAPVHLNWQYPPALARLAENQLAKLNQFTKFRQHTARRYLQALHPTSPLNDHSSQAAWLRVPLSVKNRDAVLKTARQQHMFLDAWYSQPVFPTTSPSTIAYSPGSCPVAETSARTALNLPTYPSLTANQVERVISFVKENAELL